MSDHPAHLAIYQALRSVPPGRTVTYGDLARRAGLPGRARLAGTALRHADEGQAPDWHRVIRADGSLAFQPGTEAFTTQRERLEAEGVVFAGDRVASGQSAPPLDADFELWGPAGAR